MTKNKHEIRSFMRSLPILASILGKKLGVKIQIGGAPCTDGQTIYLPPLPLDGGEELFILANGYIDHEAAHIRDTDFDSLKAAQMSPLSKLLSNIAEDVRVERELVEIYPGCKDHFKKLYQQMIREMTPDEPAMAGRNIIGWLMTAIFHGQYPDVGFPVVEFRTAVDEQFPSLRAQLEPFILSGLACDSTQDCIEWGKAVESFLFQYFNRSKPKEENPAQQPSEETDSADGQASDGDSSRSEQENGANQEQNANSSDPGNGEDEILQDHTSSMDNTGQADQADDLQAKPAEVTTTEPSQGGADNESWTEAHDAEDASATPATGGDAQETEKSSEKNQCENAFDNEADLPGEPMPAPEEDRAERGDDTPQPSSGGQGSTEGSDAAPAEDETQDAPGHNPCDAEDNEIPGMLDSRQGTGDEQELPGTPDAPEPQDENQENEFGDGSIAGQGDDPLDEADQETQSSSEGEHQDGTEDEVAVDCDSLGASGPDGEQPDQPSLSLGEEPEQKDSDEHKETGDNGSCDQSAQEKAGSQSGTEPESANSDVGALPGTGGYGPGSAPGFAGDSTGSQPETDDSAQVTSVENGSSEAENSPTSPSQSDSGIDMLNRVIQGGDLGTASDEMPEFPSADELAEAVREALGSMVNSEGEMPRTLGDLLKQMLEQFSQESRGSDYLQVAVVDGDAPGEMPRPLLEEAHAATKVLATRLSGLLQTQTRSRAHTGRHGRIDGNRLHRLAVQNPRVFQRPAEKNTIDTAVHILLDCSGSMDECMSLANAACYSVASSLHRIRGVNVGVTAFPGTWDWDNRCTVNPILKHGQRMHTHFAAVAHGGTPMGEALWWTCQQMMSLKEDRKIILVITDGYPDSTRNTEVALEAAAEMGFEIIGIGIGQYGEFILNLIGNSRVITEIQELAPAMFDVLQQALTERGC